MDWRHMLGVLLETRTDSSLRLRHHFAGATHSWQRHPQLGDAQSLLKTPFPDPTLTLLQRGAKAATG